LYCERRYFEVVDLSLSAELESELLEPAPAAPLGLELELDGEELDEDAPPLAGLFGESLELEELELGEELLGVLVEPDEDAEPDGEVLGEVLAPPEDDEDIEPDGEVVDPDGDVLRSLERLQPVTIAVPSARVTASVKVESLMRPPW
jgi:hypothetical protein